MNSGKILNVDVGILHTDLCTNYIIIYIMYIVGDCHGELK